MFKKDFEIVVHSGVSGEEAVVASFKYSGIVESFFGRFGVSPRRNFSEERLKALSKSDRIFSSMSETFNAARLAVIREKAALGLIFDGKCKRAEPVKPYFSEKRFWEMDADDLFFNGDDLVIDIALLKPEEILFFYRERKISIDVVVQEVVRDISSDHSDSLRGAEILALFETEHSGIIDGLKTILKNRQEAAAANHSLPPSR